MNPNQVQAPNTQPPPPPSQQTFIWNDPIFDFVINPFVDSDDSGFETDLNTDTDDDDDDDDGDDEDKDEGSSHAAPFDQSNASASRSANSKIDDGENMEDLDKRLRALTTTFQTEFLEQPKSAQIILTREVSQLYKSYQQHGSAARLSASILEFLDSGDEAYRSAKREFEDMELGPDGKETGRKRVTKRNVLERLKIQFVPLPEIGRLPYQVESHRFPKGRKRKADGAVDGGENRERMNGPADGFGWLPRDTAEMTLPIRGARSTSRGIVASSSDATGLTSTDTGQQFLHPPTQYIFGSTRQRRNANRNGSAHHDFHPLQQQQHPTQGSTVHRLSPAQAIFQAPGPAITRSKSLPLGIQTPAQMPVIPPPKDYSLTTDHDSQSLLLGLSPAIPFRPLENLRITLPIIAPVLANTNANNNANNQPNQLATQPPNPNQPIIPPTTAPPNTTQQPPSPYPPGTIEFINKILKLHGHTATTFHNHLIDKYTILPTASRPEGMQPPAALFRLAITQKLHSDLREMFDPIQMHSLALSPKTRALLRDCYDKLGPRSSNTSGSEAAAENEEVAELNEVEIALLGKAAAVDEESVRLWWSERAEGRCLWAAVRMWIETVEGDAIREAKRLGLY